MNNDMSACGNDKCPVRLQCARFTHPASEYQAYAEFEYDHETNHCEFYIHD